MFVAEDAERRLASPSGLQGRIEFEMGKVEMGRTFVRPSGTEDVVRVYAEAKSAVEAETLAQQIADLVRRSSV